MGFRRLLLAAALLIGLAGLPVQAKKAADPAAIAAMIEKAKAKDPAKALELAKKQLEANPLDIDANFLAEIAYDKLGRKDEQDRQHNLLMALLQSVMDGKDGKTPATAWNAVSVEEEYQILRLIGFQPKSQALLSDGGKKFDAMTVTNHESGKELTIHFNIDFFFGKEFEGLGL